MNVFGLGLAGGCDLFAYMVFKELKKQENGWNNQLEFLKKQLEKEHKNLLEMKEKQQINQKMKEFKIVKINLPKSYEKINNKFRLYYKLGYNEEKYLKHYKKGDIDNLLKEEQFTDEQISVTHTYLENKVKTLIEKRK